MKCPSCGAENIEGSDRCEVCMEPLQDLDVLHPKEGFQAHILSDSIKDIAVFHPASVKSGDTLWHAIHLMRERRAGCVLVIDEGKLTGILSEVDLLFRMPPDADTTDMRVSQIMTPDPETIDENSSMAYALHLMSIGGYRHLPVLSEHRSIGIISIKDLLRYLNQHLI
jgi:CBS domain-containing protein